MAVRKIAFADNLVNGQNRIRIWSRGAVPGNITGIKVFHSPEAGALSEGLIRPGTLAAVARPVTLDNASWSEEGATNDSDFRNPNGKFNPDMVDPSGSLMIHDPATGKYCVMTAGDLDFYRSFDGVYRISKSLRNVVTGVANSDVWTEIPGFWEDPPQIIPSIRSLPFYNASFAAQDQTMTVMVTDLEETGSAGRYRFKGQTVVTSAAGTVTQDVSSVKISTAQTGTTSDYTCPSSCTNLTATIKMSGYHHNTHDGGYDNLYHVYVRGKIEYLLDGVWKDSGWSSNVLVNGDSQTLANISVSRGSSSGYIQKIRAEINLVNTTGNKWKPNTAGSTYWLKVELDKIVCSLAGGNTVTSGSFNYLAIG